MIKVGIMEQIIENKSFYSELRTLIRSIKAGFRLKFSKPWRKFREAVLVFPFNGKNTSEKVPFLLVRFLWASKENEQRTWIPVFTGMTKNIQND